MAAMGLYLLVTTPGEWSAWRAAAAAAAALLVALGLSLGRPEILLLGPPGVLLLSSLNAWRSSPRALAWSIGLIGYVLVVLAHVRPVLRDGRGPSALWPAPWAVPLIGLLPPVAVVSTVPLEPALARSWGLSHAAAQVLLSAAALVWSTSWLADVAFRSIRAAHSGATTRRLWRIRLRPRSFWAWTMAEAAAFAGLALLALAWR